MKRSMLGMLTLLVGCHAEPQIAARESLPAQVVRVATAQAVTQPLGDETIGTVRARSSTAISASIMGTVRTLKVTLGSSVRAGDVLVQLSAGEIEAKASQASATFAQAELELKRAEQLKASRSISDAQYDVTAARLRVAAAALAEANVMRGYTTLRAPFAGVITAKQSDVGDLALPGKPLLVLESPSSLRLEASVPEAIAQVLHRGDVLSARIDSFDAPISATVSELSPSADPASRTLLVKLDLPQIVGLRPGMFGRLMVRTGEERTVMVAAPALVQRGQMETLFVVDKDRARLRIVRTGRTRDGNTEILAGLDDGERVVVANAATLVDGQPLEIRP